MFHINTYFNRKVVSLNMEITYATKCDIVLDVKEYTEWKNNNKTKPDIKP